MLIPPELIKHCMVPLMQCQCSVREVPAQYPCSVRAVSMQCPCSVREVPAQYPCSVRAVSMQCPCSVPCIYIHNLFNNKLDRNIIVIFIFLVTKKTNTWAWTLTMICQWVDILYMLSRYIYLVCIPWMQSRSVLGNNGTLGNFRAQLAEAVYFKVELSSGRGSPPSATEEVAFRQQQQRLPSVSNSRGSSPSATEEVALRQQLK